MNTELKVFGPENFKVVSAAIVNADVSLDGVLVKSTCKLIQASAVIMEEVRLFARESRIRHHTLSKLKLLTIGQRMVDKIRMISKARRT